MATLEEFEFIMQTTKEPQLEYIFRHPLIQEVAYNSLPKKSRSELHRQVAETMEKLFTQRLEEMTDILAHHYACGDNIEKALEWLKRAGFKAKELYTNDEAIRHFERIVSIIQESKERLNLYAEPLKEAYESLGDIYTLKAVYPEAIKYYEAMKNISPDLVSQATAQRKKAMVYFHQSKYDTALGILDEVEKLLKEESQDSLIEKAEISQSRGAIYQTEGNLSLAQSEAEKALSISDRIKDEIRAGQIKVKCLNNLGSIWRQKGEYDHAVEILQKSIEILEKLNLKQLLARTVNQLGVVYHVKGDYHRAIEFNEQALKIIEEIGDKLMIAGVSGNLGVIYAYLGEIEKALEFHKKHLKIAEEIGDRRGIGMAYNNLGRIYAGSRERHALARESFQKALEIFEEIGDKTAISAALGNLAIIFLAAGEIDKAEKNLLKTEQILTELGNKELLINTYHYMAQVQLAKKAPIEETLKFANQALSLAETIDSDIGRADAYTNYTRIYAMVKDFAKVEENFEKAAKIYRKIGRKASLSNLYQSYAQILKDSGQNERANFYVNEAEKLNQEMKKQNHLTT